MSAPVPSGAMPKGHYAARARERWGMALPDWVKLLADAADEAASLRALSQQCGIPVTIISSVIGNTYPARANAIAARVKGALAGDKVQCPVYGAIGRGACLTHQEQPFHTASPQAAQVWHACRRPCVHSIPECLQKGAKKHA